MAQLGLLEREMDRGSEQGTNIPLRRARDSASICTPLSLPAIHHHLAGATSRFHLTSRRLCPCLPGSSRAGVSDGIQQFLKHTRCHSFQPRRSIFNPVSCGQSARVEAWAGSGRRRGRTAVCDASWATWCSCVSQAAAAGGVIIHFKNVFFTLLSVVWPLSEG